MIVWVLTEFPSSRDSVCMAESTIGILNYLKYYQGKALYEWIY